MGSKLFAQNARNLTGRVGGGIGSLGVNEVDDGLGLREVASGRLKTRAW